MSHKLGRNIRAGDLLVTASGDAARVREVVEYPSSRSEANSAFGECLVARCEDGRDITVFSNMPVKVVGVRDLAAPETA